jgi:hypothetical protein
MINGSIKRRDSLATQRGQRTDTKVWGIPPPRRRRGGRHPNDLADLTGREAIVAWGQDHRCAHAGQRMMPVSPGASAEPAPACSLEGVDRELSHRRANWSKYDAFDFSLEPVHGTVYFGQCGNGPSPPRTPSRRHVPKRGLELRLRPTLFLRAVRTGGPIWRHPELQRSVEVRRRYSVAR